MSDRISPTEKQNDPVKLRPHHGLCIAFFIGMGYSEEFTENMRSVITALNGGSKIILTRGEDAVCAKCPKNIDGVCEDCGKTDRYDKAVLEICGTDFGDTMSWKAFSSLCGERIISARRLHSVCGDCKWYDICGQGQLL